MITRKMKLEVLSDMVNKWTDTQADPQAEEKKLEKIIWLAKCISIDDESEAFEDEQFNAPPLTEPKLLRLVDED